MISKGVHPAAYADDRSIKATGTDCADAEAKVAEALLATAAFDKAIDLIENQKKRQLWKTGRSAEHLGLQLQLGYVVGTKGPCPLPTPRGGWDCITDLAKRLFVLPGGFEVRAGITAACIIPKFCWAAPFLEQPPPAVATTVASALLRTSCTWWCRARMWAANVTVHPNLALAIRALKAAVDLPRSTMLKAAVQCHAARLQLVAAWDSIGCLRIGPCADADQRVVRAAIKASDDRSGVFYPASAAGGHALRSAARATALSFANCSPSKKRQDQEGLEDADVEITSTSIWIQWVKTLDVEDRLWLRVWRGGAIRTPSRRHRGEAGLQSCPYCAFPHASARHFWQNC